MPTAETYRVSIRRSIVALLVAYLRGDGVDVSNFNTYPVTQDVYTFSYLGQLYQLLYAENGTVPPIAPGITVVFAGDKPCDGNDHAQHYELPVAFRIRVPWDFNGETTVQGLALLLDNAIQACAGRIQIVDFTQDPIIGYGEYVECQSTTRGEWKQEKPTSLLTDLVLEVPFRYEIPGSILIPGGTPVLVPIEQGTVELLTLDKGGTDADLSATGPGFLFQASQGAPITVVPAPSGGLSFNVVRKTANYTAAINDLVECDTTAGGFSVTIPDAATNVNKSLTVKKIATSVDSNTVTLLPTGGNKLEGDTSLTFDAPGSSVTLVSNGTDWDII